MDREITRACVETLSERTNACLLLQRCSRSRRCRLRLPLDDEFLFFLPPQVVFILTFFIGMFLVLTFPSSIQILATTMVQRDQDVSTVITPTQRNLMLHQLSLSRVHLCERAEQRATQREQSNVSRRSAQELRPRYVRFRISVADLASAVHRSTARRRSPPDTVRALREPSRFRAEQQRQSNNRTGKVWKGRSQRLGERAAEDASVCGECVCRVAQEERT